MKTDLLNKRVAILVADGFEEKELTGPREALEENGAMVHIISIKPGTVKSWNEIDWGMEFKVDNILDTISADEYDALLLPGGVMSPDKLRMNSKAVHFVKDFFKQNKPVAAICHALSTAIETGELNGRRLTSYESIKTDLINAGANWIDLAAVIDKNLLTSRKPSDIPVFKEKMLELFSDIK